MELTELSEVSFPDMRRNVVSAVRALADEAYQHRVWIDRDYPDDGYYDDFEMNLHILFDDTLVLEDPAATLGTVLKSREEVDVMTILGNALDELLTAEGSERTDREYMASPLWGGVVHAAGAAYNLLAR
ncbi:MAG TPA: hypothetical protein VIU15_43810 [Streptomyces sp.]